MRDPADRRPAIVRAGDDEVHLIVTALGEDAGRSVFGLVEGLRVGVPGDAFDVPMSERVDRRARRWIVGRHLPVLLEPEDLAAEGANVLRVRRVAGVARRHIQLAVGPELHAAAVVDRPTGNVVEEDRLLDPAPVVVAHPNEAVL